MYLSEKARKVHPSLRMLFLAVVASLMFAVAAPPAHANMPTSGSASTVGSTTAYALLNQPHTNTFRWRAFKFAMSQRGDMYGWGMEGPYRYDCSGLVFASYVKYASTPVHLPRSSRDMAAATRRVVYWSNMVPGDLLFFGYSGSVSHVGIYAGKHNGYRYMIHSSRSGEPVRLVRLGDYYYSRLIKKGRVNFT